MSNTITGKELKEMQNKLFSVVAFDLVTKKRTMTYGNQSYKTAIETIIKYQSYGNLCLLIPQNILPVEEYSWTIEDYFKYLQITDLRTKVNLRLSQ